MQGMTGKERQSCSKENINCSQKALPRTKKTSKEGVLRRGPFLLLLVAVSVLIITNPDLDSFIRHFSKGVLQSEATAVTSVRVGKLWLSQKSNQIKRFNLILCSIVHHPDVQCVFQTTATNPKCMYIGLLTRWVRVGIPEVLSSSLEKCSGRGMVFGRGRCVCLPSFAGMDCSRYIESFAPLAPGTFLGEFGILEAILLLQIAVYFGGLLTRFKKTPHGILFRAVEKLVLPFRSQNIFCLLKNMLVFCLAGPKLHVLAGETCFRRMLLYVAGLSILIGLFISGPRPGMSMTNLALKAAAILRECRGEGVACWPELAKAFSMQTVGEYLLDCGGNTHAMEALATIVGVALYERRHEIGKRNSL
eukprot:GHVN01083971.1.p1 GENE.GHVN01083971.1~~GHVN01083971.1.p1  ORF type:complete len:362 (+),score=19.94 GHVN01083971.1:408-1493(+)